MKIKPTLLLFQQEYNQKSTNFIINQQKDHVKCLSNFFDVKIINTDCDYQEVCEQYEPDISLFESGVNLPGSRKIVISNTQTCEKIPKLGFHNADSWSEATSGFISDMDHWGVEKIFTICVTTAEHIPSIAHNLFVWPNFIDSSIYRDYGAQKLIPFLLTGCKNELYPWRDKVFKLISESYPALLCPHFGYLSKTHTGQTIWGQQYALTLNASWFAPACGTIAKEVVRKHFEIPACKACLITEETPGLVAAGFVDMQNCIFADHENVVDKAAYLFNNPEKLKDIISKGYELVHTQHTMLHRDQIYQWFCLNKQLKSDEKIVQTNSFESLQIVKKSAKIDTIYIISEGAHLRLLEQAKQLLIEGDYEAAETLYLKCLINMNQLAQPKVGLALCNLFKGYPKIALSWIIPPIRYTLTGYKAIDPDPVEWAYFIICLLCSGKLKQANKRAKQFPWLKHQELDRVCWLLHLLSDYSKDYSFANNDLIKPRKSIHQLQNKNINDWVNDILVMLHACKQYAVAEVLKNKIAEMVNQLDDGILEFEKPNAQTIRQINSKENLNGFNVLSRNKTITLKNFDNPLLISRVISTANGKMLSFLRKIENRIGYFLPFKISAERYQELYTSIESTINRQDIATVLVLGSDMSKGCALALLTDLAEMKKQVSVYCVNVLNKHHKIMLGKSLKYFYYELNTKILISEKDCIKELNGFFTGIKQLNSISFFDVILIDGLNFKVKSYSSNKLELLLYGVKILILDNVNTLYTYQYLTDFLSNKDYSLVFYSQNLNNSYAVFIKK